MRKTAAFAKKGHASRPTSRRPANFKEILWYKAHEAELLKRYAGRYLVISNEQVVGDYGTKLSAWQACLETMRPGSFIIHHCALPEFRRMPMLANRKFATIHE
ncbi:MAG: hypothetical protein ACKVUS_05940 [Saprospiraceae bacterium]